MAERPTLVAWSGGVGSSYALRWTCAQQTGPVWAVTVDTDGCDVPVLEAMREHALALGASEHRVISAQGVFYRELLGPLLLLGARVGGVVPWWIAEEYARAEALATLAREWDACALVHGSHTGDSGVPSELLWAARAPKLERFAPGTAVRHWYEGIDPLEPTEAQDEDTVEAFDLWRAIVGEEPLLTTLMPPPPILSAPSELVPNRDPTLARGLVILTRLDLARSEDALTLTLSGAGPVTVEQRPLASQHLLLWIDGAGAMPGFTGARPRSDELAVVDVRRDEGRVEIEVELAAGWTLDERRSLANGAAVRFVRAP